MTNDRPKYGTPGRIGLDWRRIEKYHWRADVGDGPLDRYLAKCVKTTDPNWSEAWFLVYPGTEDLDDTPAGSFDDAMRAAANHRLAAIEAANRLLVINVGEGYDEFYVKASDLRITDDDGNSYTVQLREDNDG